MTQEWVASFYGIGAGYNVPFKCIVDKESNIIVVGRSENLSFNDDCVILKYNNTGNLLWEKRFNGLANGNDRFRDLVLDDSNNIYVTGETDGGSAGGSYNWIIAKFKPNGDTAWVRFFNGPGGRGDVAFSIAKDKNNNVYVTGYCLISLPNNEDLYTIKYNSDGELQWIRVYSSTINGPDRANKVVTDDSNNVYTIGYGSIPEGNELTTIKYDKYGNELWIRKFPTFYGDYLRPALAAVDKFNNIIVNGYYYLGEHYAFNTIKYNSYGDLVWNRIYKGAGNLNFCYALCTDDSANVYAAGRNTSAGTGNDFVTIKYNQNGDTSWIRIYDGGDSLSDEIHAIAVDSLENVYVTGVCQAARVTGLDYLTIKYNSNGNMIWNKKYNGITNQDDISYSISKDKGNVFVSGASGINNSYSGIITIKYSTLTGLSDNNLYLRNIKFSLSQNYPNPFNPVTKIIYELPVSGIVSLKVNDILGKEVLILVNESKQTGKYEYFFNGSDLPSGIYFYSLYINNNLIDTKRMLLIN